MNRKYLWAALPIAAVAALFGSQVQIGSADAPGVIDFESYATGSINGQGGWVSTGPYDHKVDSSMGTAGFGLQSLRISNAVTTGAFDQTFSPSLAEAAGEPGAEGGTVSNLPTRSHFEASWQFASADPFFEQPGLSVSASPDRGDGARMSWVQMTDTPTGLEVRFADYQDLAPFGSVLAADGCDGADDFFYTTVASGLSRTAPHTITVTMDFVAGDRNDVVKVYVDGVLGHTGTSWEDYFRYCEVNPTRTVDSVIFHTRGAAAPASLGLGFLIDNFSTRSDTVLAGKDSCKKGGWATSTNPVFKNQGDCVSFFAKK